MSTVKPIIYCVRVKINFKPFQVDFRIEAAAVSCCECKGVAAREKRRRDLDTVLHLRLMAEAERHGGSKRSD